MATVGQKYGVSGNQAQGWRFTGSHTAVPETVAAAGATQGGAAQITNDLVFVTVTASTQGVKLPTASTGRQVRVFVPGSVGVKVYPNTNGKLDASSTNAAVVLAAGKANLYVAKNTTQWYTQKGA